MCTVVDETIPANYATEGDGFKRGDRVTLTGHKGTHVVDYMVFVECQTIPSYYRLFCIHPDTGRSTVSAASMHFTKVD